MWAEKSFKRKKMKIYEVNVTKLHIAEKSRNTKKPKNITNVT